MPANDALLGTVEEAMRVELYTIPLYLYALYSIKSVKQGSTDPRKVIREIVKQEMLHLTLTGNLLTALGGSPKLYSRTGITDVEKQPVPVYPNKIFKTCVVMNLASAIKSQIEFLQLVEAPANDGPTSSIGEFYRILIEALGNLEDNDFRHGHDKQFSSTDFAFQDVEELKITTKTEALEKMKLIIDQGEGVTEVAEEGAEEGAKEGAKEGSPPNHHAMLTSLVEGAPAAPASTASSSASASASTWEVWDVKPNPKTESYRDNVYIHTLSLAFDAAYCYLLQTIQRVWGTTDEELRDHLNGNISTLMTGVMTPLARVLIQEGNIVDEKVAAPCFNFYPLEAEDVPDTVKPTGPGPLDASQLHTALEKLVENSTTIEEDGHLACETHKKALLTILKRIKKATPNVE